MTLAETNGMQTESLLDQLSEEPLSTSHFLDEKPLFFADGKPAYPFKMTMENVQKAGNFLKTFSLATTWQMDDQEILEFLFAPDTIIIEIDNSLIMFENLVPNFKAHVGFVFWDRKIAGRDQLVHDTFQYGMTTFGLKRLYARVPARNKVMWRMLERLGFQREGTLRNDFILPKGDTCDMLVYGILRSELLKETANVP